MTRPPEIQLRFAAGVGGSGGCRKGILIPSVSPPNRGAVGTPNGGWGHPTEGLWGPHPTEGSVDTTQQRGPHPTEGVRGHPTEGVGTPRRLALHRKI